MEFGFNFRTALMLTTEMTHDFHGIRYYKIWFKHNMNSTAEAAVSEMIPELIQIFQEGILAIP